MKYNLNMLFNKLTLYLLFIIHFSPFDSYVSFTYAVYYVREMSMKASTNTDNWMKRKKIDGRSFPKFHIDMLVFNPRRAVSVPIITPI